MAPLLPVPGVPGRKDNFLDLSTVLSRNPVPLHDAVPLASVIAKICALDEVDAGANTRLANRTVNIATILTELPLTADLPR